MKRPDKKQSKRLIYLNYKLMGINQRGSSSREPTQNNEETQRFTVFKTLTMLVLQLGTSNKSQQTILVAAP